LLRLRRSAIRCDWADRTEGYYQAHRISAGVHWCADPVEWRQPVNQFFAGVSILTGYLAI
jgi:hypothetical protein